MRIAIQAADLDHSRIDGTRVYMHNLLKYFGRLDAASEFFIYHKNDFNPELAPPEFPNYKIKKIKAPLFWTQTRFAFEIARDRPDVLWMPMHNLPVLHSQKTRTFVTIHDLAFKFFPESFARKDLLKLNLLTGRAIKNTDRIIAISEATKKDILKLYPGVSPDKIKVIFHGFDPEVFALPRNFDEEKRIKEELGISGNYILYIGAIQPRKNLETLIEAFNKIKTPEKQDLKLVLAGEKAWLSQKTIETAECSPYRQYIIMPGKLKFGDLGHLCRGAGVFVFPSLYEGFGIPVLEAMAARVPVVCAQNSSLPEVGGEAALYFPAGNAGELAQKIEQVLQNEKLRLELVQKGLAQIKKFSWEKCARETLEYLKS